MFCHKCGTEMPDDSNFCRKCGANLIQPPRASLPVSNTIPASLNEEAVASHATLRGDYQSTSQQFPSRSTIAIAERRGEWRKRRRGAPPRALTIPSPIASRRLPIRLLGLATAGVILAVIAVLLLQVPWPTL